MNTWKLMRLLRLKLGNSTFYHWLRYIANRKNASKVIAQFNRKESRELHVKMREAWVKYHWNFEEFFYWDYENQNVDGRKSFVPEYEKNIFCDKANNHVSDLVFHDKWKTYLKFKPFFKRDAILLHDMESLRVAKDSFFLKHDKFILKPINAATGRGIQIIKFENYFELEQRLLLLLQKLGPCVAEELIVQSKIMADFHPSSVNTLRVPSFRFDNNDAQIFQPFLRIGKGGNVVDNAGAGGIMGLVDVDTGVVYAASDERCHYFTKHPDSKIDIVGFQIPRWEEAKAFVRSLAEILPDVRYVGWDIALTDAGWVLIEGNEKGQFIWQIPTKKGFRKDFTTICKKAKITM